MKLDSLKLKTKNTTYVGTFSKSNTKIEERGKFDAQYTQMHDRSLFCLGRTSFMDPYLPT
jgi:hypothetical protein